MTDYVPSAPGLRPRCGARRTTDRTLTEHRRSDGQHRVFTRCPNRETVVDPL